MYGRQASMWFKGFSKQGIPHTTKQLIVQDLDSGQACFKEQLPGNTGHSAQEPTQTYLIALSIVSDSLTSGSLTVIPKWGQQTPTASQVLAIDEARESNLCLWEHAQIQVTRKSQKKNAIPMMEGKLGVPKQESMLGGGMEQKDEGFPKSERINILILQSITCDLVSKTQPVLPQNTQGSSKGK